MNQKKKLKTFKISYKCGRSVKTKNIKGIRTEQYPVSEMDSMFRVVGADGEMIWECKFEDFRSSEVLVTAEDYVVTEVKKDSNVVVLERFTKIIETK